MHQSQVRSSFPPRPRLQRLVRLRAVVLVGALALASTQCDGKADLDPSIGSAGPTDTAQDVVPTSPATGVRLAIAELRGKLPYLTDSRGRAVWALVDAPNVGCDARCEQDWPSVSATHPPAEAGMQGISRSLIGTVLREDGTLQVTYGKRPLHYRNGAVQDRVTARVTDQYGEWSLISPDGKPVERSRDVGPEGR